MNNEVGFRAADLAFKRTAEENLRSLQDRQLSAQVAHWQALEANNASMLKARLEEVGLNKDRYKFDRVQNALTKAYGQAADLVGLVKMNEEKLANLDPKERTAYGNKVRQAAYLQATYELNFDLRKGEGTIPMTLAKSAFDFADRNPDKIQRDSTGSSFVEVDGRKVFVPTPPEPPKPQAAPGARQQPPAAKRPGIAPPPAQPLPDPDGSGARLDAARQANSAAYQRLMSYGSVQKQRDPQGFAQAQAQYAETQKNLQQAEAAWASVARGITAPSLARPTP